MNLRLSSLLVLTPLLLAPAAAEEPKPPAGMPVLVELFTSQG